MASLVSASLSTYAKRMVRLSARIFGEVARPTDRKSLRVVRLFAAKPLDKSPEIYEYYPRHSELNYLMLQLRNLGLFRNEHADFKEEMTRLRALRGKVRPKKGEGKQAAKKKK